MPRRSPRGTRRRAPRRSEWSSWDDYPERSSPLPADGIKAQTRAGKAFGQTWWGGKWIAALERLVNPGRLQRGRSYARRGQVLNIDFEGTAVKSRVQGSRSEPYEVSIKVKSINEKQWAKVIDVMAAQAIYAAKLLAGEMPQDIEDAFSSARVALFPERAADLGTECSCPDYANPCKHISAVYYLLGERFDADPFLLFQLRGRSKDEVIAALRARRGVEDRGDQTARLEAVEDPVGQSVRAEAGPGSVGESEAERAFEAGPVLEAGRVFEGGRVHEAGPPLSDAIDRFWELDPEIESMQFTIARPAVDAAAVKRLGQPAFWKSKLDFMTEMESIYRAISEAAIRTVLGDE